LIVVVVQSTSPPLPKHTIPAEPAAQLKEENLLKYLEDSVRRLTTALVDLEKKSTAPTKGHGRVSKKRGVAAEATSVSSTAKHSVDAQISRELTSRLQDLFEA
jgi:hypothetical protein